MSIQTHRLYHLDNENKTYELLPISYLGDSPNINQYGITVKVNIATAITGLLL